MLRMVPLPAIAGEDARTRSRDTMRREFLHRRYDHDLRSTCASEIEGVVPSFRSALSLRVGWVEQSETHHLRHGPVGFAPLNPPYEERKEERKWNADRRCSQPPCCWHGRASSRRRTPIGVPPRFCPGDCPSQVQLQAMLPGTWISADPVTIPIPGAEAGAVFAGVTRLHLSHVQRAPRGRSIVPGD